MEIVRSIFLSSKVPLFRLSLIVTEPIGHILYESLHISSIFTGLDIWYYRDDNVVEHIDINQTLTGGISGMSERRILDWTVRLHEDHIFGTVLGKSRCIKVQLCNWYDTVLGTTFIWTAQMFLQVDNQLSATHVWVFQSVKNVFLMTEMAH